MDKSSGSGNRNNDTCESSSSSSSAQNLSTAGGSLGCGLDSAVALSTNATVNGQITVNISTTTGGTFSVTIENQTSVENLKKTIAKKLKVAKDRICLLHRERELQEGTLKENGLLDGSKIILIPNVETGLLAQRPENTVMQALESLNDSQVNDFLSGKTPLNLSMRLGDHMMLIQLQLSTVNPSSPSHASRTGKNSFKSKISTSTPSTSAQSSMVNITPPNTPSPSCSRTSNRSDSIEMENSPNASVASTSSASASASNDLSAGSSTHETQTKNRQRDLVLTSKEFENLKSIVNSLTNIQHDEELNYESDTMLEQSPIKSLSNLVSSPMKTTPIKSIPITKFPASTEAAAEQSPTPSTSNSTTRHTNSNGTSQSAMCQDPISAKLTSCLCKRLDTDSNSNNSNGCDTNCQLLRQDRPLTHAIPQRYDLPTTSSSSSSPASTEQKSLRSSLLHRTNNNPISKLKHRHNSSGSYLRRSKSSDNIRSACDEPMSGTSRNLLSTASNSNSPKLIDNSAASSSTSIVCSSTDTRALAEASRNLTQTLRKLSKEVFTNKVDISEESQRKNSTGSGAVIESMKNHGKGIYSGTFSGTLNPALQDRFGRPKRDISTVIHILNDLLSATPQYSRGARISFEPTNSRTIKQVQSRRQQQQQQQTPKETCKCTSVPNSPSCTYGECNGHLSTENILQGPYCDKHKPIDDPAITMYAQSTPSTESTSSTPSTSMLTLTPTTSYSSSCRCSKKVNSIQQKYDESSNDSLNSNDCQCQFRSFDPTAPEDGLSVMMTPPSPQSPPPIAQSQSQPQPQPNATQTPFCIKCSSIELENSKTKNKLEQLRLVMQQKKERREARKLRIAPYGNNGVAGGPGGRSIGANNGNGPLISTSSGATTTAAGQLASSTITSPNDVVSAQAAAAAQAQQQSASHLVEEVDTAA